MADQTPAAATPPLLTKFFILERTVALRVPDPNAEPSGPDSVYEDIVVWAPIGEKEARDRDHALRLFLSDPARDVDGMFVAVSENGWKPRNVTIKQTPQIKIEEAVG